MESIINPKSSLVMELRRVLKRLMTEHDVTVAQLSRATKVPVQTLHNWVGGQPPRDVRQVKKVADHFEVSLDFLLFGAERKREIFKEFQYEINAGIFEVILRRVKK